MNKFHSFIAKVTMLSLVVALVAIVSPAQAATITSAKDTMSRVQISTLSNHEILFTTPTGVASGATIIVTFNTDFSVAAALDFTDLDLSSDSTPDADCSADETEATLAAAPSGATVGAVRTSGTVITFTNGTTVIAAGSEVCIQIGTNATNQTTGVRQVTNATTDSSASAKTVALSGTFGDSGTIALGIVDDDTVAISATVTSALTFDLDTVTTDTCSTTETAAAYAVALGTITTTDTRVSGGTDSVESICVDLNTNASGGAVITVVSANGSSGLVSTSVPGDTIPSAGATMADGTANYGICVVSETSSAGTFDDVAPFDNASCAANTETNVVGGLTTSAQTILDTNTDPIATGRAQIAVNAAISGITPAHSDYADTLTFIATGTF
ncbi:hypothetical protein EPO34_03900 [Patescibacteria group bacterium]|nr:MAG: hypothetical protein EPO34_03900 [Patescibacteria group bacterium]